MSSGELLSRPRPARSYRAALARVEAMQAGEGEAIRPLARTIWMTHGRKRAQSLVLFHGLTSSPRQFAALGERFHALGYNVLIPRVPYHGYHDRMSREHARLTAEQLVTLVDEAVDIAQGVGERVTVAGLSMGGTLSGWAAQARADVGVAALLSPALGLYPIPDPLTPLAVRLARVLPNRFLWWDATLRAEAPGPPHAYPRFSTRALAETLRLGLALQQQARHSKPAAAAILALLNPADRSVSNTLTRTLLQQWQERGKQSLYLYEFDPTLDLPHDLIDPAQPDQQVEVVYPLLLELLQG